MGRGQWQEGIEWFQRYSPVLKNKLTIYSATYEIDTDKMEIDLPHMKHRSWEKMKLDSSGGEETSRRLKIIGRLDRI